MGPEQPRTVWDQAEAEQRRLKPMASEASQPLPAAEEEDSRDTGEAAGNQDRPVGSRSAVGVGIQDTAVADTPDIADRRRTVAGGIQDKEAAPPQPADKVLSGPVLPRAQAAFGVRRPSPGYSPDIPYTQAELRARTVGKST